jgi:hypothetical protein
VQGVVNETPLMIAAANGLTDILKCLVQAGANPNVHDCVSFYSTFCSVGAHQTLSMYLQIFAGQII